MTGAQVRQEKVYEALSEALRTAYGPVPTHVVRMLSDCVCAAVVTYQGRQQVRHTDLGSRLVAVDGEVARLGPAA